MCVRVCQFVCAKFTIAARLRSSALLRDDKFSSSLFSNASLYVRSSSLVRSFCSSCERRLLRRREFSAAAALSAVRRRSNSSCSRDDPPVDCTVRKTKRQKQQHKIYKGMEHWHIREKYVKIEKVMVMRKVRERKRSGWEKGTSGEARDRNHR